MIFTSFSFEMISSFRSFLAKTFWQACDESGQQGIQRKTNLGLYVLLGTVICSCYICLQKKRGSDDTVRNQPQPAPNSSMSSNRMKRQVKLLQGEIIHCYTSNEKRNKSYFFFVRNKLNDAGTIIKTLIIESCLENFVVLLEPDSIAIKGVKGVQGD